MHCAHAIGYIGYQTPASIHSHVTTMLPLYMYNTPPNALAIINRGNTKKCINQDVCLVVLKRLLTLPFLLTKQANRTMDLLS